MDGEVLFPFDEVIVTVSGIDWLCSGTAVLCWSAGAAFTQPGLIDIRQVDRLGEGELHFEDFPLSLMTAEEQLAMVGALAIKVNADAAIHQHFLEGVEP